MNQRFKTLMMQFSKLTLDRLILISFLSLVSQQVNADDKRTQAVCTFCAHFWLSNRSYRNTKVYTGAGRGGCFKTNKQQKKTEQKSGYMVLTAAQRVKGKGIYIGQRHLHRTVLHVLALLQRSTLCPRTLCVKTFGATKRIRMPLSSTRCSGTIERLIQTPFSLNMSNLPHRIHCVTRCTSE